MSDCLPKRVDPRWQKQVQGTAVGLVPCSRISTHPASFSPLASSQNLFSKHAWPSQNPLSAKYHFYHQSSQQLLSPCIQELPVV